MKHRKPRPTSKLRAAIAGIGLTAAAATGAILTDQALPAQPADTTWGAPDTSNSTAAQPAADDVNTTVTPQDTTWG